MLAETNMFAGSTWSRGDSWFQTVLCHAQAWTSLLVLDSLIRWSGTLSDSGSWIFKLVYMTWHDRTCPDLSWWVVPTEHVNFPSDHLDNCGCYRYGLSPEGIKGYINLYCQCLQKPPCLVVALMYTWTIMILQILQLFCQTLVLLACFHTMGATNNHEMVWHW